MCLKVIDRDLPLKKEISKNIKRLMKKNGWTQIKLSEKSGISKSTLSDYINCKTLINPGNVEKLSEAFNVPKSEIDPSFKRSDLFTDTVEESSHEYGGLTEKEKKDIALDLERLLNELESNGALSFYGEPVDDDTRTLLRISVLNAMQFGKEKAKEKFNHNKKQK